MTSLSNNNKDKIKLVWVNNKSMIDILNNKLKNNKKELQKKKKIFKAYSFDH